MRFHSVFLFATVAALGLAGRAFALEKVIQDSPARLVVEVEVPAYSVAQGLGGADVVAPGFSNPTVAGAPALPAYRFQVASGSAAPRVSVEALDWALLPVPGGLAGVPRWITNQKAEEARDAALFAAADRITPETSPIQLYRGLSLRTISLPLGTYGGGAARLMKRFRVTVDFAGAAAAPAFGVRPWLLDAGVKNPNGGQYLTALPHSQALRKAAIANQFPGGTPLLKIRIGDRQVDGLEEDGVYSLTYEQARAAGLPAAQPIATLRVYAGPQDIGSLALDSLIAPTLREIPVRVDDADHDQTFDAGDRILFYAHGTSLWKPIPGATGPITWAFSNDPYSFENYYYLDWSGAGSPLRLDTTAFVPAAQTVTKAPHYLRGEKDLATGNCDISGRFDNEFGYDWYWYSKGQCSDDGPVTPGSIAPVLTALQLKSAADTLKGYAGDTVRVGVFTSLQSSSNVFQLSSHGAPFSSDPQPTLAGAWYSQVSPVFTDSLLGLDSLRWAGSDMFFEGYTVQYARDLKWRGKSRRIFPAARNARVAYRIQGGAGLECLRIVNGYATHSLAMAASGGDAIFTDSAGADEDVGYFLYQAPAALAAGTVALEQVPTASGVIENLVTGDGSDPQYLIIAPQAMLPGALNLRAYRDNAARQLPLATAVVRTEDIYREWSGGRLSPVAIRDFIRWAVNRWGAGGGAGRLKYVLLYGDGHFDYRNIRNATLNNPLPNHVPPFDYLNGISTDDFYAVLDAGESWEFGTVDISLGRLPVQTLEQAQNYLDKVKRYEDPATSGEWRSRVLLAADDATQRRNLGGIDPILGGHTEWSENMAGTIQANESGVRFDKVYLFDYAPNSSFLKPEATQDLLNDLNRGELLFNFYGHGAYNQMADEVLLKTNDGLSRLRNLDKAFMISVFSCTVGRFDKLADEGMTEQFLRQKDYAAIAAFAASRETFNDPNGVLGPIFGSKLFLQDSTLRGIGDVSRLAKNSVGDKDNAERYVLLGEPVLLLRRPGLGLTLGPAPDTLHSLGCDTLRGRVTQGSGRGAVSVRVVSGDVLKTYTFPTGGTSTGTVSAEKPGQVLFERTIPYKDSAFVMDYFLPKQVPFGDSGAKIQVFAWDSLQPLESSVAQTNIRIQGTANCVIDSDKRGPRIAVTGCNTKESGDVDFPDQVKISLPYCVQVEVTDSVGGVMSGDGPDEGTTLEVVGAVSPYHPQAGQDDLYRKTYQLTLLRQDLTAGTHLLKVSARDGFGNLSQRQLTLQVSADTALRFLKALNIPNPMKRNGTTFYFSTTVPVEEGADLTSVRTDRINFHLRIFNQQGLMVREFRDAVSGETQWDGKDAWGNTMANGVYFYQVTGTWDESNGAPGGGQSVSRKNVLVISR